MKLGVQIIRYLLPIIQIYASLDISQMQFDFTPNTVSVAASYSFTFLSTPQIPTNYSLQLDFPQEITLTDSDNYPCSSSDFKPGTTCTASNNKLKIVTPFASSKVVFSITVLNVGNPPTTATTDSIMLTVLDGENIAGALVGDENLRVTARAREMSGASISTSPKIIGAQALWTFEFQPALQIVTGSKLQIELPYWDAYLLTDPDAVPTQMVTLTTITCQAVSPNLNTNITCSYQQSSRTLTMSGGFSNPTSEPAIFTVNSIRNPPGPEPFSGFVFKISDSLSNPYEILDGATDVTVTVTEPGSINNGIAVLSNGNTVGEKGDTYLSGKSSNPVYSNCIIEVTIPSQFKFDSSMIVRKNHYGNTLGYTIENSNTIRINNAFTKYNAPQTGVGVTLIGIQNPTSTLPSQGFIIKTLNPEAEPIDVGQTSSVTVQPGTIVQNQAVPIVLASDTFVNTETTYSFEFVLPHGVPQGGLITITFPSQVMVQSRDSSTSCLGPIVGISGSSKCQVIGSDLQILNAFTQDFAGGVIKFKIDKVTNPATTQTTEFFKIKSHPTQDTQYLIDQITDSQYIADQSSGITITATPSTFTSIVVTPTSLITGATTVYRFEIEIKTEVQIGGYFKILFPNKVSIQNLQTAQDNCIPIQSLEGTMVCTATSTSLQLNNGIVSKSIKAGDIVIFQVASVKNPPSTNRFQSFTITSYDISGNKINETATGVYVQPTQPNTLPSVSVQIDNKINGEIANYTFSITTFNEMSTGSKVKIIPPAQVTFPIDPSCQSGTNLNSISCIESQGEITATLTLAQSELPGNSQISFTIQGITNPGSTRPTATFQIFTFTSIDYQIDQRVTGVTVATTTPSTLTDIIISASDYAISAASQFTIVFTPENTYPAGTSIEIRVPSEIIMGNVTCESNTLDSPFNCLVNGRLIVVDNGIKTGLSAPNKVNLTLKGFTNGSEPVETSAWQILVKDGSYQIDQSNDKTITYACSTPCKTCQTTATFCTSCEALSLLPYLYNNTCNAKCQDGTVDDVATTDKICVNCSAECKTCTNSPTTCTSCYEDGEKPYFYDNTCNAVCQDGKYGTGTSCLPCNNPCVTCQTDTECLSCGVSQQAPNVGLQTFLNGTQCVVKCPDGWFANSTTKTCEKCSSSCLTCSETQSKCTSCTTDKRLKDNACVSACPTDNRYIDTGAECLRCEQPCDQCQNIVSQCSSCLTGLLYQNQCISTGCPDGTTNINGICKQCDVTCGTCSGSVGSCSSCAENFAIWRNQCLENCPQGTTKIADQCEDCNGCKTCQGTVDTCLSCQSGTYLYDYQCINQCPVDNYVPVNRVCEECDTNCKTCEGVPQNCTSCNIGFKLSPDKTCVLKCPDNSIQQGDICVLCDSDCATCATTTSNCTSCKNGYKLDGGSCVDSCSGTQVDISNVCQNCHTDCLTCSGTTTNCTACKTNTYLYNNYCYSECPQGWMIVGGICEEIQNADCSSGCTEPKMLNTSCDFECNVEACNFDNGKCVQGPTECGDGYYQQGNACKACENGCNTCASATTCYSCNDSQNTGSIMLLYEGACYDTCPEGTFKNGIACSKCNSTCKTCIGSANTCLTCIDGLFLYNNSCINSCPAETTVTSGIQCLDCSINCLHCEGTYDTCTSCPPEKVQINNQCKTKCPDGYTIVTGSGNVCQKCSDSCVTCNGSVNDCSSCATNQFLYQNNCVGSCPGGTYANGTECKACVAGCVTCSGGSVCTACDSSKVSFNGLCLEQCPAGYQPNNGACEEIPPPSECAPGCTDTLLNDDKCDAECNNSACNTDNQRCAFSGDCPINQYVDGDQCKDCLLPCASCTSPSSCTACSYQTQGDNAGKTMFLYKDSCYDVCPSRTMQIGIKCYDCNSNCLSCAGDVNTCTTCEEGKVLSDGQCLNNCPADITVLVDQFCQPCNSSCATCSGTVDTCTTCSPDRYLYNGKCFIKCPDTTTAPPSSNVCESCQGNCLNCSQNSNNCTSCKEGYFLYNNSCLAQCPEKITVQKGSSCAACQDPCIECQTDTTLCTVCKAGTNLYQNSCSADCPTGFEARLGVCESYCADGCNSTLLSNPDCDVVCNFKSCNYDNGLCTLTECGAGRFRSGQDCVNCEYPCNNCSSLGYCTSCQVSNDGNNTQLLLYNGQCLVQCPVATYRNGLVCEACPQNCNVCQGTVCLECAAPKVLYNNQCINTCPQSTTVKVDQVCEPCNANCSTCGPNTDTCTSCPQGKVLSAGVCVSECQPGFTTTPSSAGQCLQCEGNCETCSGSTSYCTKCKTGKLLDGGCLDTCPYGYAAISSAPTICTRCSSNCVNCEETIDKCTQCGSNQYLTAGNTCQDLPECPDGLTLTSTSNGVCLKCLDPCNTCEESVSRCTSCKNGLALDNYQCTECNSPCATCEGTKTTCKTCEQGYYLSGTKCLQCDSNCNTCTTNSYTCSSCKDGFFLSEGKCLNCSSNCLTCQDTALKCTSCNEGQFLLNNQCVSCSPQCLTCESEPTRCTSCRSRTYIEDFQCKQCDSTCNECEVHASNCLSCNSGQTLINGVCGFCKEGCTECITDFQKCSKCPDDKTLINGECGNCNQNCATCEQSYTECSSCNSGKYLQGTQCLACDSNCATCELDATHCTSCSPPLSMINNKCVVCDEPCKTCSNTTSTCTSCFQPLVIIGSTCVRCDSACKVCSGAPEICVECDGDKYLNGNTCSQCSENCLGCETSEDNCTSCPTGSELIGNTCLITCPQGYVRVDSQCVECEANCKTCFGTPSSCTSCEIGFVYDNRCVTSCPTGFFKNPETCEQCSSVCKECVNSANTCSVCFEGDKLNNGTCEPICPYGQYVDGGACVDCHPNCKTCRYDAQHCTSCPNPDEVVNSISKVCEVPCEEGYTRTNQSNGVCVKCADQCKTCYGTIDFCLGCSNMNNYIYEGECLPICPAGTAGVGNKCKLCEAPCLTCKGATSTCTSCNSEQLFLFENLCIDSCPEGFEPIGGDCKECLDPTNCPYVPINNGSGSGDVDSQQPDDDNTKPGPEDINTGIVPFPFAGLTLISFSIVLVSKLAVGGINFLPSIISLLSISCFGSWGTVGANFYLDDGDGVQFGRRLVQLNPLVADMGSIGFTLILFGVAVLIVCNIVFVCCFLIKLRKDKQFHNWRSGNKCCYCFYICICMVFNLHFIRLIYSNMCNKNCFNASFDRKSLLLSPLSKLTYVTLALTCLPIIVGLCLLLLYLEMDQLLWMLSADSLFLTLIFTLLLICDLKKMETTIIRLKFDKAFPVNELTKLISLEQQKFNNLKLRRVNTYTQGEFREIIKPRQRSLSFPLLQPITLPPLQESKDAKSNESFLIKNESTIILDEEFTTITGQFEAGLQEKKDKSNSRPNVVSFHPLHITDIEEFTEVVAFTEQMDSSEDYIDSQTVQEEQEFDFSRAIQDPDDPELVIVPHKITGERYKIRKGFQGSRIVDNNNQIIEIMPPITETSKYDMSKTVVDEADPIYATLRTHQGDKVKVKRNFNGARIVDLEAKVKYPNSQLIGQTIDIESELILHNAYPDTKDPETIITTHAVTGDDIKVRKTFHNARVVDSNGTIIEEEEPIDRNDYDIKSAIVDKNDVHLATLRKRQGNSKVFVRRDFRGAKIIDIIEKPKKQPVEKPPPVYEEDEVYNKHPMEIIKPKPPRPNIVKQKIPKKPKLRPLDLFDYEELDPERQKLEDLAKIINQVEEEQHELIQAREYNETPYKPNVRQNTTSPSSSLQNYQTRNQWIYSPDFQGFQSNPDSLYNSRLSNYDEEPLFALRYAPDRRKNYQQTYDARKVGNQRADSNFRPGTSNERDRVFPFVGNDIVYDRHKQQENV